MACPSDTIRFCLLSYPTIHKNAADVLEHILITNGCGYEWIDGEPVCHPGPGDEPSGSIVARELLELEKRIAEYEADGLDTLDLRKELHDYRFVVGNIDEMSGSRQVRRARPSHQLYPQCEYALINNIPPDITDDWLKTCHTFTDTLISHLALRKVSGLGASDSSWEEILPGRRRLLDDMMVERGLIASRQSRAEMATRIINEILAEERSEKEKPTLRRPGM